MYHQGDVGEASYAAVPHLLRIYQVLAERDWTAFSLAGAAEFTRLAGDGPELPSWASTDCSEALRELTKIGLRDLAGTSNESVITSVLGLVAVVNGLHNHRRPLPEFTGDDLQEIVDES